MPKKILINLLSEQRMPNFIATMEEQPDLVYALTTEKYQPQVKLFEEMTGTPHERIHFEAYDLKKDIDIVAKLIAKDLAAGARLVLNFTGGTKIMSLAATLAGIRSSNSLKLIYIDTHRQQIEQFAVGESHALEITGAVPFECPIPFKAYILLNDESIASLNDSPSLELRERFELSKALLSEECDAFFSKQKSLFSSTGKDSEYRESGKITFRGKKRKNGAYIGRGECEWDAAGFRFKLPSGKQFNFRHGQAAQYLAGAWPEELCFVDLSRSKLFDQVIQNVELSLRERTIEDMKKKMPRVKDHCKNEIDVVATRGAQAAMIECKAGKITQDHINKLAVLRDQLLGSFGIAVLVSRHPLAPNIEERCRDLKVLTVFGDRIKSLPRIIEKEFNR